MRFGQLEYEIKKCEEHLDATGTRNTEIENYLVRYLLVLICAEYEKRIKILVQNRCARINDPHVLRFAHWGAEMATKCFNIGDIATMLNRFGEDYKKSFHKAVENQRCHVAWDNIYTNRHAVAHGHSVVMMNFTDLQRDYRDSVLVIDELVKALCLRPKDTKGLK